MNNHQSSIFLLVITHEKTHEKEVLKPKLELFWVKGVLKKNQKLQDFISWIKAYEASLIDEVDMELVIGKEQITKFLSPYPELVSAVYHSGLTDHPASALRELLILASKNTLAPIELEGLEIHSGELFDRTSHPWINPLVFKVSILSSEREITLTKLFDHHQMDDSQKNHDLETINLCAMTESDLANLSTNNCWALELHEMLIIKNHYSDAATKAHRMAMGLPIEATLIECEIFAQAWSEHCKHKIFASTIDYTDDETNEHSIIQSLFKTYIAGPTQELMESKKWLISVFKDNAGIVRFNDYFDYCIKVETHNSPSALDPYGGALTGLLGVHRDIMGTGLGGKPVANTNVLLFAAPDDNEPLPLGLNHPREIFHGVHRGIQDGGNKTGVPTINGAIHFHPDYRGKPVVYCGAIGVLPQRISYGEKTVETHLKPIEVGDYIVMAGGAVGADGLHGATASSLGMDEQTPLGMVQIGDPFMQKKLLDFLIKAKSELLYRTLTDNGAGGLSSSIGEMCETTNGAEVHLERASLKALGLSPWQIFLSESQERMTLAVPKEKWPRLLELASEYQIHLDFLGEFTNSGFLNLFFHQEPVGSVDLRLLHQGLPPLKLVARYPKKNHHYFIPNEHININSQTIGNTLWELFSELISNPTIASKEYWTKQYDQEVQGATILKPYESSIPSGSGALWDRAYVENDQGNFSSSESQQLTQLTSGAVVASGLCPHYGHIDTYLMAQMAVDEAVIKVVIRGADPNMIALVDNFCWPDPVFSEKTPDGHFKLAQLVRANRALKDMALSYEMPFISGKDSMKNDFYGKFNEGKETKKIKISIPPTLLITALGKHPQVSAIIKNKTTHSSKLYLISPHEVVENAYESYWGEFLKEKLFAFGFLKSSGDEKNYSAPPMTFHFKESKKFYHQYFLITQCGLIEGATNLSEGGLCVALFEMLLSITEGAFTLDLDELQIQVFGKDNKFDAQQFSHFALSFLFSEYPGRALVSVLEKDQKMFEQMLPSKDWICLGTVKKSLPSTQKKQLHLHSTLWGDQFLDLKLAQQIYEQRLCP